MTSHEPQDIQKIASMKMTLTIADFKGGALKIDPKNMEMVEVSNIGIDELSNITMQYLSEPPVTEDEYIKKFSRFVIEAIGQMQREKVIQSGVVYPSDNCFCEATIAFKFPSRKSLGVTNLEHFEMAKIYIVNVMSHIMAYEWHREYLNLIEKINSQPGPNPHNIH